MSGNSWAFGGIYRSVRCGDSVCFDEAARFVLECRKRDLDDVADLFKQEMRRQLDAALAGEPKPPQNMVLVTLLEGMDHAAAGDDLWDDFFKSVHLWRCRRKAEADEQLARLRLW